MARGFMRAGDINPWTAGGVAANPAAQPSEGGEKIGIAKQ
jgi:hypothetical protein